MKVYIINSITKSYILNIKIRPLVTEYALMIKLVDGTSSAHSFNPFVYFGHSWSYFDIQSLRLVILYIFVYIKMTLYIKVSGLNTWDAFPIPYYTVLKNCFIFSIRIKIIHGNHSLYDILTWLTLFSLHFIPPYHSG